MSARATIDRKNALYSLYRMATENALDALGICAAERQKLFLQNKYWDVRRKTDVNSVAAMLEPKTKRERKTK
jgi:hypothetical protein